jgi:hypothetical protein
MREFTENRGLGSLVVAGAAALLLAALAVPAEATDVQTRGGGARTQLSPGAATTSTATASVASRGSSGSSSSGSGNHYSGGHRGGHHGGHHGGYYGRSHYRGYSYSYNPYFYLGFGHYPYYYGSYGYYGGPYRYDHYYSSERWGSLDLDIRPEKAQVYVNGQYVGVADNYDGFPEFLWLKEGTYNIVFYLEGYETLTRKVTVLPGIDLDFQDRLEPGNAVAPTELAEEWMREPPEAVAASRARSDQEESWRDRARRYLNQRDANQAPDRDQAADQAAVPRRDDGLLDARGEPARLVLNLEPADASVYLDGRFLGTAEELSRLHAGLLVDAGEHTLEVVHPSFRTERRTLEVEAGDELEVGFQLARQ